MWCREPPWNILLPCVAFLIVFFFGFLGGRLLAPTETPLPSPDCSTCPVVTECPPPCVCPEHPDSSHFSCRVDDPNYDHLKDPHSLALGTYLPSARSAMCSSLTRRFGVYTPGEFTGAPPEEIPPQWTEDFTFGGHIKTEKQYINNVVASKRRDWDRATMEAYMETARKKEPGPSYGKMAFTVYEAMENFPPSGHCLVVGTVKPFYEATLLAYGAEKVTTIDFQKLTVDHPDVTVLTVDEWSEMSYQDQPQFDCSVSISSLEHDGLGRYGDPVNPFGDLWSLQRLKCMLKPGALFYISVPVEKIDSLYWNGHRRYGPLRLSALFKGWTVVGWFGAPNADPFVLRAGASPTIVLRNDEFSINDYSDFRMMEYLLDTESN